VDLFVFLLFLILIIVYAVKYVKGNEDDNVRLAIFVVLENFCFFSIVRVAYSGMGFETRYWLFAFFEVIPLLMLFIQKCKRMYIQTVIILVLTGAIVALNFIGDFIYYKVRIDYNELEQVAEILQSEDAKLVYAYGNEMSLMARNLRCVADDKFIKILGDSYNTNAEWGGYIGYIDNAEEPGATFMLASEKEFQELPYFIQNAYSEINCVNNIHIYYGKNNILDLSGDMREERFIDFPYTNGYNLSNGDFDKYGAWVSDGTEGYCLQGPHISTREGEYNISLYYDMVEKGEGESKFDIILDDDQTILGQKVIENSQEKIVLRNIKISAGHSIQYRVFNSKNAKIALKKIEVEEIK